MIIINHCLNPSGFDRLFIPWLWPTRNKGCIQPHLFASYLHLRVGSWMGTNALLLGVFQVTLFCPGLRRTCWKNLSVHGEDATRPLVYSPYTPRDIKLSIPLLIMATQELFRSFTSVLDGFEQPNKPFHAFHQSASRVSFFQGCTVTFKLVNFMMWKSMKIRKDRPC